MGLPHIGFLWNHQEGWPLPKRSPKGGLLRIEVGLIDSPRVASCAAKRTNNNQFNLFGVTAQNELPAAAVDRKRWILSFLYNTGEFVAYWGLLPMLAKNPHSFHWYFWRQHHARINTLVQGQLFPAAAIRASCFSLLGCCRHYFKSSCYLKKSFSSFTATAHGVMIVKLHSGKQHK